MLKKLFKIVFRLAVSVILLAVLYLLLLMVTAYKPKNIEILSIKNNKKQIVKTDQPISVLSFDISYCGMDKNEGSDSDNKKSIDANLKGITDFIASQKTDFILLQEVDKKATRSSYTDEPMYLTEALAGYVSTYAYNYKVIWIPVPLKKQTGYIESGMSTFSKYLINVTSRYKYPGQEKWPGYLISNEPCFIEARIPADNGKELIIVNSHISDADKSGGVRKHQLDYLKKYITNEYKKGNYVIVGGNWSYFLPRTDPNLFRTVESCPEWLEKMPEDFTPSGFTWAVDKTVPSIRSNQNPYEKNINFTAVTDGFLVSDNIQTESVNNSDLGFKYSDHNPAKAVFLLKK